MTIRKHAKRARAVASKLDSDPGQARTGAMLDALEVANRVLCAHLRAKPPGKARPWETCAALIIMPGFEPNVIPVGSIEPRWGSFAHVHVRDPACEGEEFHVSFWGATHDEAIEKALYFMLTL